ncbi:hypothetical protein LINGRAHAP2_LOCUS28916 [Linum grandiflorum]
MLVVLLRLSLQIWEAVLLLVLSCERLSMVCNSLGLWVFGGYRFNQIRWQQLLFLLRNLSWIINMRLLFSSLRNSAIVNGKSISPTFTVKQIILRIICPILTIISSMGCIFLILLIGVCPIGYIIIL